MNQANKYIPALTGLRFFAAFFVLMPHVIIGTIGRGVDQMSTYIVSFSGIGMPLFFVLSGFVIHYTYSEALTKQGSVGWKNFAIARFARLYPLYIILFSIIILTSNNGALDIKSLSGFIRYITLTQTWNYEVLGNESLVYLYKNLNFSAGWSISTEVFLYLIYPFVCFLLNKVKSIKYYVIFGVASLLLCIFSMYIIFRYMPFINEFSTSTFGQTADFYISGSNSFIRWLVYFSPIFWIFIFTCGCCAAASVLYLKNKPISKNEQKIGRILLFISILYLIAVYCFIFTNNSYGSFHEFMKFSHTNWALSPALTIIIFCCARYQSAFSRFMERPKVVKLGDASYSLYLLHDHVISFILQLTFINFLSPSLKICLIMFCAISFSIFSYRTVEVPCRIWLRNKLMKSFPLQT
ncbi:MAG: acyltransferase [Proteobacteria bacterium]|nr:acyltransferase [Pseudomonadota bacterium]